MRSYIDIIIDLQDGKKVEYEEARLAAIAGSYLLQTSETDIKRVTGFGTKEQKADLKSVFAISNYETRFKSKKMPVDKYLGSWHPDTPGRQEERKMHMKIWDNFEKSREEEEE